MRATFVAARVCALLTLGVLLAGGCGAQEPDARAPTPAQAQAQLAGSPAALTSLHRQAGQLLDGGLDAYKARLTTLTGRPIVVNAWASWCPPCRSEMPYFSRVAIRYGRRVAFVGLNVNDDDARARAFLKTHFVPYPSFVDPHSQIADEIGVRIGLPTTVFYGRDGSVSFIHAGPYRDEASLAADVQRYAGVS